MSAVKSIILFAVFSVQLASAHEGPPYPLATEISTEYGSLGIWTDPDVGDGTFMLVFKDAQGLTAAPKIAVVASTPLDLPKTYGATPTADPRQYTVKIPFAREGLWNVEFNVGRHAPLVFSVDVTPPGPSPWQIWLFIFPFALIGLLWGKLYFVRRRAA